MGKVSPAAYGWGAVFGVATAYDVWALATGNETLTGMYHRLGKKLVGEEEDRSWATQRAIDGFWLGLTWHLVRRGKKLLPERYHMMYRRVHPLWLVHDLVVARGANAGSRKISAPLEGPQIASIMDGF